MSVIPSYLEGLVPWMDSVSWNLLLLLLLLTELSVKSIFKERFDIPELVTDDVDENERLKFIFDSFSKFASNPDHVYQALRSEFLLVTTLALFCLI